MNFDRTIYLLVCFCIWCTNAVPPIEKVMNELIKVISEEQIVKPVKFRFPEWEKQRGLYRSEIRINFHGETTIADLRKNKFIYAYDNNMFATGWILSVLLETTMYGRSPQTIDTEHLSLAMDAIDRFHDRNLNDSNVPLMTFWEEMYNNMTHVWASTPDNLHFFLKDIDHNLLIVEKVLKDLGIKNVQMLIDRIINYTLSVDATFEIPPDFDDTYLNVGLGAQLKLLQDQYPSVYSRWAQTNSNMKKLVELTLRYAYRPSSDNLDLNTIDPRTYLWIRDFIRDHPQAILPSTWAQNITEVRKYGHLGVRMPFNVNNIDVTVAANVLYGITTAILNDLFHFNDYFNEDMQTMYLSAGQLISWSIKHSMNNRPDLAQVYYPSEYNFLWYGSRTLFLLQTTLQQNQTALPPVFILVHTTLADAYRQNVVKYFEDHVRSDQSSYDDFLGVNDTNIFGKNEPTGEDRIFSTAQVVNTLIASFTYFDKTSGKLKWIDYDEEQLKKVEGMMNRSVSWLIENAFKYDAFNCFFSGSVKGFDEVPFWYPGNIYEFLNGSAIDPDHFDVNNQSMVDVLIGVHSYINETIYERMLNETHFNFSTPIIFKGYNAHGAEFPFWSSQPYTYSVTLLALAQYNNFDK